MMRRIRRLWCRLTHGVTWMPFRGRYTCAVCFEEWECWK